MLMYEGAETSRWNCFAPLICLIYNVNRGKDQPALQIEDVHPFATPVKRPKTKGIPINSQTIGMLKALCGKGRK